MPIGKSINKECLQEHPILSNKNEHEKSIFIPEDPKYSLNDLIVSASVKEKLLDVANYAKNSRIVFETWGLDKTHKYSKRIGINLYGAPGTGKTMAAHAISHYLDRKILVVNYADIESKYVGETPKNIRKVFQAAKDTHSILFFDEADAILSKRVTNMSSATDVSVNQTRSVMLMIMNEYQDFIIFATNFIENFDMAFMRRISMHVKFELPDVECRKKLWRMYISPSMPNNVDIDEVAEKYDGITGSDISNAILNAAFKAARKKENMVPKEYIAEAVEDIVNSKDANNNLNVTTRPVTEKYARKQLGDETVEQVKHSTDHMNEEDDNRE